MASPICFCWGVNDRCSNNVMVLAVFCIWSIVLSIAVIKSLMSPRSNGVIKVRRTAINTNAGRISRISETIAQIESQADDLHDEGLRELYRVNRESNSMAFFVGHEVYDHLEKVADRFDDVANEVHGIMLENV